MYLWKKSGIILPLGIFVILLVMFSSASIVYTSEIDEKTSRFLLIESEITGFELNNQRVISHGWPVSKGQALPCLEQKWFILGSDNKYMYIKYRLFDSIPEAIRGTAYNAGSYASPYYWGSISGSIVGDYSWNCESSAIIFMRGNVGIKIFFPLMDMEEIRDLMQEIAHKILLKIEDNLYPEIIAVEEEAREKQIPLQRYNLIVDDIVSLEVMSGFSCISTWDSKWLVDENRFIAGIRKEWKNEDGKLIGIDICERDSDDLAMSVAEIRVKESLPGRKKIFFFDLDSLSSDRTMLEEWEKDPFAKKDLRSLVSYKGKIAVHIYGFDPDNIKADTFYSLAEQLSSKITF